VQGISPAGAQERKKKVDTSMSTFSKHAEAIETKNNKINPGGLKKRRKNG